MPAQVVQVNTYIPISTLWAYLSLADFVSWNPLFNSVSTSTFQLCGPLDAVYSNSQFLTPILPTNLNGPHYIIQMGCDPTARNCAFAWWFNLIDNDNGELITYGRHTFSLLQSVVDPGVTIVQSWEKAAGVNVKMNQIPWTNALQESLIDAVTGIVCLERVYQSTGGLDPSDVKNFCTHFSIFSTNLCTVMTHVFSKVVSAVQITTTTEHNTSQSTTLMMKRECERKE